MLMEDRTVRELTIFNPLLEEMELGALRRLAIRERAQIVDVSEDALQPYVPSFRWPRNDDPPPPPLLVRSTVGTTGCPGLTAALDCTPTPAQLSAIDERTIVLSLGQQRSVTKTVSNGGRIIRRQRFAGLTEIRKIE